MNCTSDTPREALRKYGKTDVEKCDELLEAYYELAQERAALETEGVENEASTSERYAEISTEMHELDARIADLFGSFR